MGYENKRKQFFIVFLLLLTSGFVSYKYITDYYNKNTVDTTTVKGDVAIDCDIVESKVVKVIDSVQISRKWYLIGNELDSEYTHLSINADNFDINEEERKFVQLYYEIKNTDIDGLLEYSEKDNSWFANIELDTLSPNTYDVIVYSTIKNCEIDKVYENSFNLSYPVYVTWTMDWEGFDVKQEYLDSMANISDTHGVPITHFFNPYIYMHISNTRSQYLTDWVLDREEKGDSIGLHLHMFNDMVKAAGVEVNTSINWGSWAGNGHDVPNSAYGYDDYKKIILWALDQFEKNNLPRPDMYRAGGWFMDEENLQVINDLDFVLDSSGRSAYTLGEKKLEGHWNLNSKTQPYQLNSDDQNITNNPNMKLWEIPNNANDSWAFSADQMIERFNDNYLGGISKDTKVVTFLSHPHWFNVDEPKMEKVFNYTDNYNILSDEGPVIYISLDNLPMLSENM